MTIRIICALMLIFGVETWLNAGDWWIPIAESRIILNAPFTSNATTMMGYLGDAQNARAAAYERLSVIIEEHCTANPDECTGVLIILAILSLLCVLPGNHSSRRRKEA